MGEHMAWTPTAESPGALAEEKRKGKSKINMAELSAVIGASTPGVIFT